MESGSETESDVSLSPGHRYSTQPNNAYIHPPSGTVTETLQSTDDPPRNTTDDWTQAIRYLFDLRMEGVDWVGLLAFMMQVATNSCDQESDTILQEQLREASGVLMRTLEEIATPRHLDSDRLAYLAGFLTNLRAYIFLNQCNTSLTCYDQCKTSSWTSYLCTDMSSTP